MGSSSTAIPLQDHILKPGPENPADVLSRLPISNQPFTERDIAEEYVNHVIANAVPKAISLEEIQTASAIDPTLQQVRQSITTGNWPKDASMRSYFNVRQELSIQDDLVVRGTRLVLPDQLQKRTLDLAHEGHQGIVKTKQLLREKVWWPGIDRAVETMISHCLPCQAQDHRESHQSSSYRRSELAARAKPVLIELSCNAPCFD